MQKEQYLMTEFVEQSGKSRQTIHDWVRRGLVEPRMFGGRRVFGVDDILRVPLIIRTLEKNRGRY